MPYQDRHTDNEPAAEFDREPSSTSTGRLRQLPEAERKLVFALMASGLLAACMVVVSTLI